GNVWETIEDMLIQNNKMRNCSSGMNIAAHDDSGPSGITTRVAIRNNLVYNIDNRQFAGENRLFQMLGNGPSGWTAQDMEVSHNTFISPNFSDGICVVNSNEPADVNGMLFQNNVCTLSLYGFFNEGLALGGTGLAKYWTNLTYNKNMLVG